MIMECSVKFSLAFSPCALMFSGCRRSTEAVSHVISSELKASLRSRVGIFMEMWGKWPSLSSGSVTVVASTAWKLSTCSMGHPRNLYRSSSHQGSLRAEWVSPADPAAPGER